MDLFSMPEKTNSNPNRISIRIIKVIMVSSFQGLAQFVLKEAQNGRHNEHAKQDTNNQCPPM
jgi:hypothetical protein